MQVLSSTFNVKPTPMKSSLTPQAIPHTLINVLSLLSKAIPNGFSSLSFYPVALPYSQDRQVILSCSLIIRCGTPGCTQHGYFSGDQVVLEVCKEY
jgi:hypothetical protein